jgi:hypothetical protein
MGTGNGAGRRRHVWLWGRVGALLAIVIAGTAAIVHYSSLGTPMAGGPDPAAAAYGSTASSGQASPAEATSAGATSAGVTGAGATSAGVTGAGATSAGVTSGLAASGAATGAAPKPAALAAAARPGAAPVHFRTLPPGAALPSGAKCARWVRARPMAENKAANKAANHTTGQHVGAHFFAGGDTPQANRLIAPRINGNFTGTTKEILRWAACKWGIDQSVVFAQAAVESWWQQNTLGDWAADASACPPGHQPGADGKPGLCPQSYGILQNRFPYEQASWPGIGHSTAMNADTAYAIWRSCYDGYEVWLNNVPHGQVYRKGDLWGCVGRWFAGRWHTAPAQQYIVRVQQYQRERIWLSRDFQQG